MTESVYIAQLENRYRPYLRDIIAGNPFTPIVLRGGKKIPDTTPELHQKVELFQKYEKGIHGQGWRIEWETRTSKRIGVQQWPAVITVDTEEDYLYLTGKLALTQQFKQELAQLTAWRPDSRDFLFHRPEWVLDLKEAWPGIRTVVDYLLQHDVRDHYLRSLPVPVHTKFIEQYKTPILAWLKYADPGRFPPEAGDLEKALGLQRKPYLWTMRWLDPAMADNCSAGKEISGVTTEDLAAATWNVKQIVLTENETNLYLLPGMKGSFGLFSSGKALALLTDIGLFGTAEIYYWGDLDEAGFAMLNSIRTLYSHVKSLFMDIETVTFHEKEILPQPAPYKPKHLPLLFPSEQAAYLKMAAVNGRIEQEKLQQDYIATGLCKLTGGLPNDFKC
jgi:hypothetical protein